MLHSHDSNPKMSKPSLTSLTSLPHELLLQILEPLPLNSLIRLRRVSRLFAAMIPKLTHDDCLRTETSPWACDRHLLACGGCVRLRHASKFSMRMKTAPPEMVWTMSVDPENFSVVFEPASGPQGRNPMGPGGSKAHTRFCNECGARDLPGEFRHGVGEVWDDEGVYWVRCSGCGKVAKCPERLDIGLCEVCYNIMLENANEIRVG